jgi:hypothetical protein
MVPFTCYVVLKYNLPLSHSFINFLSIFSTKTGPFPFTLNAMNLFRFLLIIGCVTADCEPWNVSNSLDNILQQLANSQREIRLINEDLRHRLRMLDETFEFWDACATVLSQVFGCCCIAIIIAWHVCMEVIEMEHDRERAQEAWETKQIRWIHKTKKCHSECCCYFSYNDFLSRQ